MFKLNNSSASKIAVGILSAVITLSLSYSLASASTTNGTNINFRKGPGLEYETYENKLNNNTNVTIVDVEGDWLKVIIDGTVGYVCSQYVSIDETNATINDDSVRMRTTPAFDNNIFKDRLNKGKRVLVLSKEYVDGNIFYAIEYNKKKMYVFHSYIDLDESANIQDNAKEIENENARIEEIAKKALLEEEDSTIEQVEIEKTDSMNATVNCDVLNVRKRPSKYSNREFQVKQGTRLSLIAQNSGNELWYCFLYNDNQVWVDAKYVTLDKGIFLPVMQLPKFTLADEIVDFAKSFETSHRVENRDGLQLWFDCSSYVRYVYANFGILLKGGSRDIYNSGAGQLISYEELQPGDLVFVRNNGYEIGHVGIYVGDDKMISNESSGVIRYDGSVGGGIHITTLNSGYYWPNYTKEYMRLNNIN